MKTFLRFIFSAFVFIFLSPTSHAQLKATFTYADGYNACGESYLKISLNNTSSIDIYPIIAEFQLNSAMQASAFTTSLPDSKIIMSATGNKVKIVFDTLLTNTGLFDINVKMVSTRSCDLSGCGTFLSTTDTLALKYNSKETFFYNTSILGSPCLTYDETLFSNRLTSAFLGDTITRKIILTNTGGGKFDGYVQLKDVFGEFISIESIYSTNTGYTLSSAGTTNDSTYIFKGKFSNIMNGDSIVIIEKVIVTKCIVEDEGKSSIYIDWSCNNALCNKITPYPIIAQVLKNKKKPDVVINWTAVPESNCMGSKTKYVYTIKNQGTRPATGLKFKLRATDYNTYTYISKNSLVLKDTTGMLLLGSSVGTLYPTIPLIQTFQHTCTIADPLYEWDFEFESLMPDDSFQVEAEGFQCCPGDDTSNVDLTFETWYLSVDYKDECKEESFSTNSTSPNNNILYLRQFYEPIITDMHEDDVKTFEIFNNDFTTDFYRLHVDNAAFKIRIKLDTGLVYVPNTLKLSSVYGYTLSPTSEQLIAGVGVDGYNDPFLEATFILPDTFITDHTFFGRFMRNSSVLFNLKAVCPAKVPSSRFTQDFLLIPDMTCNQTCEILLASTTTLISVHCPGCITPGWVATSHTAMRINLGEKDNDNNRLPDNLTYTAADRSKIKNNRCIPGDTLQTELIAYFQDGDPLLGKTAHDLATTGPAPFEFNYSYLINDISFGKLFNINSIKVFITDFDKTAITSGVDSVMLPLSCVTKIPNPKDTLSNAQFFFDLSLDSLHKYGIDPAYKYAPNDGIRILCVYNILEPSSLYLSNPPTTTDPWFERDNSSILLNSFNNIIYLTGERNTATDNTRADAGDAFKTDPNSLDSTMIYWCEGYGSASTIVGKRREYQFTIPANVQCKERASFYVALHPSGGIFRNAFPFEYRNFMIIDSVQAFVPPGYKFEDWTITNTISKPDGFLEYEECTRTDTLKNIHVRGPIITVHIDPLYVRQTDFGDSPCIDKLVYGDEEIVTTISYNIVPDCDLPETKIIYSSPTLYYRVGPNRLPYHDISVTEQCLPPTGIQVCKFYPSEVSVKKMNAGLKLSPVTNEIQLSQQTFCYPINLEETKGENANYSFLKIKSLHHKVKAEMLTNKETNQVYFPDAFGVFHLDTTLAKSVEQYELCLSNICGKLIAKDTVRLIFGHDCFSYPDSTLSNICKLDSIEHYVFPGTLAIGDFVSGPDSITMCEGFEIVSNYQVTGIGGVEDMLLNIKSDSTSLLSASMIINDEASTDIFDTYIPAKSRFDLKQKILAVKSDGIKAGDKIKITLKFNTDCQYKGSAIASQAVLITSACDTLYADSLKYTPPAMKKFPTPDNKLLALSFGNLQNLGGQIDVTINATNLSATATNNTTRITFLLPLGFTYASMSSGDAPTQLTDTSIVWDIAAGIASTATKTLRPILNYNPVLCDSIVFHALLGDISVGCSSQPCVQRDTLYSYKIPVTCYPCPPEISISERCKEVPVFNVLTWQYTPLNYCPDDRSFFYTLYYSTTHDGNYTALITTQDKTYTHDSLAAYDGCYYVTVSDSLHHLSSQSDIICKSTCREQFQCGDLFIPNLVTPNKDGSNETFEITGNYTSLNVEIYNSWGSTVFHSDNYKNEWYAKGLSDGVYFYEIHIDGSDKKCVGWVQVLGNKQ
ncbi:MAG: hypothetical protein JWO58_2056 [Chitinophagaceae bacterium]|nr:hypothetical protein [Chitinophagaceae bacterium]